MRNKHFRKLVVLMMVNVLIFLSITASTVSASATNELSNGVKLENYLASSVEKDVELFDTVKLEKEAKANDLYTKIMTKRKSISNSEEFDDVYGGSYIDESGNLIVMVTALDNKNIISDLIDVDSDISYKVVKNTYSELITLKEFIEDKYTSQYGQNNSEEFNLVLESMKEIYIDDENNSVVVCMSDISNDMIQYFRKYISSSKNIEFEEIDELTEETTLKTGQEIIITHSSNSSYYSIGFRASKSTSSGTIYGFVTAAHSNAVGEEVSDPSWSKIGVVESRKYSGNVDAAFVEITEDYDVSNTCKYSNSSGSTTSPDTLSGSYYITYIATGSTVYKVGRTTYKTSGTVKSSSTSWTINGNTFTDLVKADYDSDGGDSGGVVYTYFNSAYKLLGIHKGSSSFLIWHSSYAVQADNIISDLGIAFY